MARSTWIFVATTVAGIAAAGWLYRDNRALHAALDARPIAAAPAPVTRAPASDPWTLPPYAATAAARASAPGAPALPDAHDESRLDRRNRHQQEFAAMFGRAEGERDAEYRARIVPLVKAGLLIPRQHVEEMRKQAEDKAHVTPAQSKQLDRAFDKVYADVLDYTNKAIGDGQLSPYERNVSGWLEYAGGLGGMLNEAQGQIGQILTPDQVRSMFDSGFEWGEYLGAEAPWEQLDPPPAAKPR